MTSSLIRHAMPVIVRRPPAELSSGRMALAVTIEMTLMAPLYERLGDRAVNIAGQVIYIADIGPSVVRR
jgi:phosphate uptake regulator